MIVYSRKVIQFVRDIKQTIRDILSREVRLKVGRERFYGRERTSYPIAVVIYNHKAMLGYFDPSFYELGFHECLMHASREELHHVIRHELAHYMTFIKHGETVQPHGVEFREFCKKLGWGEDVYRATLCLEGSQEASKLEESGVFRKIQKLLALATSSNTNEAEQAMIKSQQLLLKYNIESKYMGPDDEKVFLKRILKQKKETAKMRSIARILGTFFVSTVFRRGQDCITLEILGSAVNLEIAEYVADFLQVELDHLWDRAQKHANLKGMIAKNSFFLGLAKGYCDKIQALKREHNSEVTHALMVIEKKLTDAKAMAYPRLSSSRSSGSHCPQSSALGQQMGRELNIKAAIHSSNNSQVLIPYRD